MTKYDIADRLESIAATLTVAPLNSADDDPIADLRRIRSAAYQLGLLRGSLLAEAAADQAVVPIDRP